MNDVEESNRLGDLRNKVLFTENIPKLIFYLSAPLIISASVQSLYDIVDTLWLSRLGSAALGTPTVSWPYRGILMSIGFGLASSISALAGQYIGAGMFKEASRSIGVVLGLLLLIGIPGTLIFFLLRDQYLLLTNVPEDVSSLATAYIGITLLGVIFNYLFLVFNFALSSAGDTKTPMKVSVVVTLTNFVLDPILIFYAGLGVMGAALATLISMFISGIYAVYSFVTGRHGFKLGLKDLLPEKQLVKLVAKISIPLVSQRLLTTLGFLFMIRIVSGLGTPVIAAYSIGQVFLNIDHVISFPIIRSIGIIVAQSLGAGLLKRAKKALYTGLVLLVSLVLSFIIFLLVIRGAFIDIFTDDPYVFKVSSDMLLIFGPSVLGFNLLILGSSIARTSGHTFFMSLVNASRLWTFRIPLSWLFAYYLHFGDVGLWLGMALSNYITGAVSLLWLMSHRWLKPIIPKKRFKGFYR